MRTKVHGDRGSGSHREATDLRDDLGPDHLRVEVDVAQSESLAAVLLRRSALPPLGTPNGRFPC